MIRKVLGLMAGVAIAAIPVSSLAQRRMPAPEERPILDPVAGTSFACTNGENLLLKLATRNQEVVAIVDAGDGPHTLDLRPWKVGDLPQIVWSDGRRTLTWNPGVQIMWMDGAAHRDCGRSAGGHQH